MKNKYTIISKDTSKLDYYKSIFISKLNNYIYDDNNPDYCFTIGGDGTLIHAIHKYISIIDHVIFVGIHAGTLGFFSDYTIDEIDKCLDDFLTCSHNTLSFNLLQATYNKNIIYALNEIRVEALKSSQLIDVSIDDVFFERFRGNGLLVCTQIGSTAYNRSLNGSIIDHSVNCIQLTEISGVNRQQYPTCGSSIIFDRSTNISFKADFKEASILYDLFEAKLSGLTQIDISLSDISVKLLNIKDIPYLKRIKTLF